MAAARSSAGSARQIASICGRPRRWTKPGCPVNGLAPLMIEPRVRAGHGVEQIVPCMRPSTTHCVSSQTERSRGIIVRKKFTNPLSLSRKTRLAFTERDRSWEREIARNVSGVSRHRLSPVTAGACCSLRRRLTLMQFHSRRSRIRVERFAFRSHDANFLRPYTVDREAGPGGVVQGRIALM
jgi:hypothetical protein